MLTTSMINAQMSPEIDVNNGIQEGYTWPRIVLAEENALITWGKSDHTIFTNTITNGVRGIPTIQNPNLKNAFITEWASTEIASEGNNIVIVYKADDAENGSSYIIQSKDGGQTFNAPVEFVDGSTTLHRFPAITLNQGVISISYMHFEANWREPQYVLIQSFDDGATFTDYKSLTGPLDGEACDCCVSNILGSDEDLVLLFRNVHNGYRDIYSAYFPKDDIAQIEYKDMDLGKWALQTCPATGSSGLISDNIITSTFMSGQSGRELIYISQMDMDNDTLIQSRALINGQANAPQNYPQIAGYGDTLGIVWQSKDSPFRNVYFSYSTNGFENLGKEVIVLSESSQGNQINPDIAYKDGVFHMTWQDNSKALVKYRTYNLNSPTGVKEIDQTLIEVGPIPTSDQIQIKSKTSWSSCKVIDTNGTEVDNFGRSNHYNMAHLINGTYFLVFINDKGERLTKRIIKN